jgi:hypothetical protein
LIGGEHRQRIAQIDVCFLNDSGVDAEPARQHDVRLHAAMSLAFVRIAPSDRE